ncbi:hypothetical protein Y032_0177g602 [Ancylostoma ceylanicum]|uniref:MARVEL domain-containing protein n=2 Tax=Ancylostoma ceylanicum TaxID=53326 RepID=A0A016STC2_9BILA|nr:hypothetical protein Y032_0177g602 [Ancylostoma ceylanicum]
MAESILSCDNMKVHPTKDSKKDPPQMIVLSTAALATDDSNRCRRTKPPMPKMCFLIPIKAAAIFGVASLSILAIAIYVYCMIHLLKKNSELNGPQIIAILSVALVIILLFAILFIWGLFANRHRLLLPFTTLSCFLLFAVVGTLIATIVTSGDEFNAAVSKAEGVATVADLVIFRVILGVTALVLAIEVYAYIRMFLYIKAVRRVLSR